MGARAESEFVGKLRGTDRASSAGGRTRRRGEGGCSGDGVGGMEGGMEGRWMRE
jgi:hypothetical protein